VKHPVGGPGRGISSDDRRGDGHVAVEERVVSTSNAKSGGAAAVLEAAKLVFPEASLTVATPVAARATTSIRTVR